MDEERLEELFRKFRMGAISQEEWIEVTTPRERMHAVIQYDTPNDDEILTMEQLAIAMEIRDRVTAPDEVDTVSPEDIDGPQDLDLSKEDTDECE